MGPLPDSPDIDPDALTPTTQSSAISTNELEEVEGDMVCSVPKKKKKKKTKKHAKVKGAVAAVQANTQQESDGRPVLCISRNKHWRYISSYHGQWLQLPLELLDSLLSVNLKPASLFTAPDALRLPSSTSSFKHSTSKQGDRGYHTLNDYSPPDCPRGAFSSLSSSRSFLTLRPGKAIPPPIDPGVFKSVNSIRHLIDEAAELSVRASSGLNSAELGSSRSISGLNNAWTSASALGINPLGASGSGGRNVAMSAMRTHRLRALAVQKLAQAYKADEIASSVMIMQGGNVFDDLAERVLRYDPTDLDAKYVHFFHEKIPSRQLAQSTSTRVLDELIVARPQHLEYYRTRGIVHCFRDEYTQATKDFTYALKEARAVRKAKATHHNIKLLGDPRFMKNGKRKKVVANSDTNGQAPPNGTSTLGGNNITEDADDVEPQLQHPSILPSAPDPIEPQLLFLRGAAYLQYAFFLIETAILRLEGVQKDQVDGSELRLCYLEHGKYGGVEIGNPDGPLGKSNGTKVLAYREVLAAEPFREQITSLLKKSIRDHEKFLSHFDSIESPNALHRGDIAHQMEYAFLLAESLQPSAQINNAVPSLAVSKVPAIFTTYHPLIVESQFSVLISQLMLADFIGILPTLARTAAAVDGLDGCPIFFPARSMSQAEFMELLERLAGGWAHGVKPHSLVGLCSKGRPSIEAPPSPRKVMTLTNSTTASLSEESSSSASLSYDKASSSVLTSPPCPVTNIQRGSPCLPVDGAKVLDSARILLAPVAKRQRLKAERTAIEVTGLAKKKPSMISIPLHGPRVEIILAWLGAVHLPELDAYP